jgi:NADH dehydrogenase FAD-containing subunit
MQKHLILVGGGHAHMTTMRHVDAYVGRGHRVTLISPSPYHYYSGMGPGMLGGFYRPQQIRFNVRRMVEERGGAFVEGEVARVEAKQRTLVLADERRMNYDVASFNTGSGVPLDNLGATGPDVLPVKPIHNLLTARRKLLGLLPQQVVKVLVIGGGAAGVEIAGNLWRLAERSGGKIEITLIAGRRLLGRFRAHARTLAATSLARRGILVREGPHVRAVGDGRALLDDHGEVPYDLALIAAGVQPSGIFRASGLPVGRDGGLLVNPALQSVHYPQLFGGGDCIAFRDRPLDKVGVYAVRENPILHGNLLAALEGRPLARFAPQKNYLLILNMGNGRGVLAKGSLALDGRWAFRLKDGIDRRFIRRFQLSGELDDPADIENEPA